MPKIYVYSNAHDNGWLKVGQTTREKVEDRINEQIATSRTSHHITLEYETETTFSDKKIHAMLKENAFIMQKEWVNATLDDVKSAIIALQDNKPFKRDRVNNFPPRDEQQKAVDITKAYFTSHALDEKAPKFMWNAKMRFGKTFTTYQLANAMAWHKVLVLTFKPAVKDSWKDDLETHTAFDDWTFLYVKNFVGNEISKHADQKIICFGSLQDVLTFDKQTGQIKEKNEEIHLQNWDCIIFDEFHFGAWRERTQDFTNKDKKESGLLDELSEDDDKQSDIETNFDVNFVPIKGANYLYLSGTPFRAMATGDFLEDQIYNWSYSDEQSAKEKNHHLGDKNPYKNLPKIKMYTYKLPNTIKQIADEGEFDEFALNEFFKAEKKDSSYCFKYQDKVINWLNFITGQSNIKEDLQNPNSNLILPFSSSINQDKVINHFFWYLPNVASCFAMANLLKDNIFLSNYHIITIAGKQGGTGAEALSYLKKEMYGKEKTITLSCGKLTTGVTVGEWQAIFMLRDIKSPESYFQSAFRVQSSYTHKEFCYIFDFSPNRALSQLTQYSSELSADNNKSDIEKLADFIKFLPVIAYDGSNMQELNATEVYDFTNSYSTASMLAKAWKSASLVNVENSILEKIMASEEAMAILEKFEFYRKLKDHKTGVREDIFKVISLNKEIKELATKDSTPTVNSLTQKKLFDEKVKERQSKRKQIRDRLLLMAQRLPVFMYLSDYREQTLQDVIEKLEPDLFEKTTNITVDNFKTLNALGVFNKRIMNDAVFKFRLYEEFSLDYLQKRVP